MEFRELKKKNKNDLHKILAETRDKLRDLRFKDANKQLKNIREIRTVRQAIARILMLLNFDNKKETGNNKSAATKTVTSKPSTVKIAENKHNNTEKK